MGEAVRQRDEREEWRGAEAQDCEEAGPVGEEEGGGRGGGEGGGRRGGCGCGDVGCRGEGGGK